MLRLLLSVSLLLSWTSTASAQLVAAKEGPIVYGHHHINTTSVEAQKKFFVDTLGGTAIRVGTNNLEIVRFHNVLLFFRLVQSPPGGTRGTTANHIGFSVPNLRAMVDKVKAAGYPMITNTEATPDRVVTDDIAGPPPGGGSSIAFVLGPDDLKVELVEAKAQMIPVTLHHVHFFTPNNMEMQAWYVKTFGATSRLGGAFPAAILPGVTLNFSSSPTPVVGTQGRALDHIGFEVKNLEAFTKKLEADGIKLAVPYRKVPALGIAIAFFTDPWGTYIELTEGLDQVASAQTPTPGQIDGTDGARATAQTRPPDNRRPRGTAVGLLGWKVGIRSDAFGAIPFSDAAAKIDAAGIAFVEGVSSNLLYTLGAEEVARVKNRLTELGLRVPAYRIESIPADEASRRKLQEFVKALEIELILTRQPAPMTDVAGVNIAVEDGRGVYKQGAKTLGANLGDASKAAPFLLELSKQQLPEAPEWPNKCGDCATSRPSVRPLFFTIAPGAAENYDTAVRVAQGYRVNAISRMLPITTIDKVPADERQKIDAAVPRQALATPKQPRKLLIIDVCPAGGFYHTTIAHGNLMLQLIAKYTGAYEPIFDNNLDNLKYPRIKRYDAVFLNSVVGPVFSDPEVLDGLIRYVREGGGVAGLHGVTFASQDVRAFGELMGAQEGPHQYNGEPGTLKIDDPDSPLTKHFGGKGFSMIDEFYHFPPTGPYTREKLHVLVSVDAEKSDLRKWQHIRPDNDYGMVWIKNFGKGRVFNSVLGHRPEFYMMPDLVKLMLGGIQFALGDLEADTTPSAQLASRRK